MTNPIIPEIDVLIAASLWLKERGVLPLVFSVATGHGIDSTKDKHRLKQALITSGIPESVIRFANDGPDIIAVSQKEYWQIECKGAGSGKESTQRNNFDRALASTVSYYCDNIPQMPEELKALEDATPVIGLVLPSTRSYLTYLRRRVQKPIRQRLNLWVLLYDINTREIVPIPPDADYSGTSDTSKPNLINQKKRKMAMRASNAVSTKTNSGARLNEIWNVRAQHALYHKDGIWFMPLERFPGAYFDPHGYILFKTRDEYLNCSFLDIGERVNVKAGIKSIPGYVRVE